MSAIVTSPDTLNELFAALEELLKRIADTDDPEIRRKRAQVREEMIAVQSNLAGVAVPLSVFRHSS